MHWVHTGTVAPHSLCLYSSFSLPLYLYTYLPNIYSRYIFLTFSITAVHTYLFLLVFCTNSTYIFLYSISLLYIPIHFFIFLYYSLLYLYTVQVFFSFPFYIEVYFCLSFCFNLFIYHFCLSSFHFLSPSFSLSVSVYLSLYRSLTPLYPS